MHRVWIAATEELEYLGDRARRPVASLRRPLFRYFDVFSGCLFVLNIFCVRFLFGFFIVTEKGAFPPEMRYATLL